jgi:mannonate dehydratase
MHISEQLLNPSAARLRLSTRLGVEHVVLDTRGLLQAAGVWSTRRC